VLKSSLPFDKYSDAAASVGTGDCNAIQATNSVALTAINYACGQRGLPYVWGGNGPQDGVSTAPG
jgi:cell wall-associated NlpC family hydrolase